MFIIIHDQKTNPKIDNPEGYDSNGIIKKGRYAIPPNPLFYPSGG
jgi:hypothetical protein